MTSSEIQPGDIACVPVPGPVGWGIGLGEILAGAPFTSHRLPAYDHTLGYAGEYLDTPPVALRYVAPSPDGRYGAGHYVFEAHPDGARFRRLAFGPESYPRALWSTGLIQLTPRQRAFYRTLCETLAGTPYSALDYAAIGLHHMGLNTTTLRRYISAQGHQICSQLQDFMYARMGEHLFTDNRWPGYVDPWDIARLLLELQLKYPGAGPSDKSPV